MIVNDNVRRHLPVLFFTILLVVGLFIFRDYGVSWDEPTERSHGVAVYNYIFHNDPALFFHKEKYHGPAFEFFLVVVEKLLHLEDLRDIYLMRHLMTFLFFYTGVIFFYLLLRKIFRDEKLPLLGCLMLVLSPRIFAHSFFNDKDIPLLASFIFSAYSCILFFEKPSLKNAWLHALACAFSGAIRIIGLIMAVFTVFFAIGRLIKQRTGSDSLLIKGGLWFIVFYLLFQYAFLPVLWVDPFWHIADAFREINRAPWMKVVLYAGGYLRHWDVPWHYLPLWLLVSIPLIYWLLFCCGLITMWRSSARKLFILMPSFWFFMPMTVAVIFGTAIYDSWRHFYFIYPAFVIIAVYGFDYVLRREFLRRLFLSLFIFSIIPILFFFGTHRGVNYIYFNSVAYFFRSTDKYGFDMDYWGLGYKQCFDYVFKDAPMGKVSLYVPNLAGEHALFYFPKKERDRVVFVQDYKAADYYVTNLREYKDIYPYQGFAYPGSEVFSLKIGKDNVAAVYKLRYNKTSVLGSSSIWGGYGKKGFSC